MSIVTKVWQAVTKVLFNCSMIFVVLVRSLDIQNQFLYCTYLIKCDNPRIMFLWQNTEKVMITSN